MAADVAIFDLTDEAMTEGACDPQAALEAASSGNCKTSSDWAAVQPQDTNSHASGLLSLSLSR